MTESKALTCYASGSRHVLTMIGSRTVRTAGINICSSLPWLLDRPG
jgi:hypothetical protein